MFSEMYVVKFCYKGDILKSEVFTLGTAITIVNHYMFFSCSLNPLYSWIRIYKGLSLIRAWSYIPMNWVEETNLENPVVIQQEFYRLDKATRPK